MTKEKLNFATQKHAIIWLAATSACSVKLKNRLCDTHLKSVKKSKTLHTELQGNGWRKEKKVKNKLHN